MSTKARGHGHDTRYVRLQKNYLLRLRQRNNPEGMRLKFSYDEERDCFVCRFRLGKRFTGRPVTATAASSPPCSMRPWAK